VKDFVVAFVTLFVAVDAVGILPLFIGLTEDLAPRERRRIIVQSLVTATVVAIVFVFFARKVFDLIGIHVYDFMVAGGVLLFAIALLDLVSGRKFARQVETVGAVPIGIPLIVGPAVLTSSLILADVAGIAPTLAAIVLNIAIAGAVFLSADLFTRLLGQGGSRAVSKVASLILAAFGVMMIRRGIVAILAGLAAAPTGSGG
jgi:multiple antibiotic resistance protein